uniref:SH2 domain-containing protein n=1 Tax=Echinostoma caproni TaxID=27848 RepID=A0A183B1L8_9TREM
LNPLIPDSNSTPLEFSEQEHIANVDDLIRPSPNFFDDVVIHPSSSAPTACSYEYRASENLSFHRSLVDKPVTVSNDSMAISSMPPTKSRHYDEEDYKSHRHLIYPRVHQPLKAMEPRTLRRVRERLLALRAALRPTDDDIKPNNSGASQIQHDLVRSCDFSVPPIPRSPSTAPIVDPERRLVNQEASVIRCNVEASSENHLDPSSPSLAEKACAVGQALKSRQCKANPWSAPQPSCSDVVPHRDTENLSVSSAIFFVGGISGQKYPTPGSIYSTFELTGAVESHTEEHVNPLKKHSLRYRRRRRSRSKQLPSAFQPSLTKLSEEGSPLSSSTTSSSLSLHLIEPETPKLRSGTVQTPEESIFSDEDIDVCGINVSNVISTQNSSSSSESARSPKGLCRPPNQGDNDSPEQMIADPVSDSSLSEENSYHDLMQSNEGSEQFCSKLEG